MKPLVEGKLSATHENEKYMQKLSAALLDLASRVKRVEDSAAGVEAKNAVEGASLGGFLTRSYSAILQTGNHARHPPYVAGY
jgi:hypothetical protein